jgi:hypothetical protein
MEVSGVIAEGEAVYASDALAKRLIGRRRYITAIYFCIALVLAVSAHWALSLVAPNGPVLAIYIVAIGGWGAFSLEARRKAIRAAWQARGVKLKSSMTYRVEPTQLVLNGEFSEIRILWTSIVEVAPIEKGWLFVGQGSAYYLPDRFLAGADRPFLRACWDHLPDAARARSSEMAAAIVP